MARGIIFTIPRMNVYSKLSYLPASGRSEQVPRKPPQTLDVIIEDVSFSPDASLT